MLERSLQHERQHVDAGATSPTTRSKNSVIQTVHSLLMRRFSLSTCENLLRDAGKHFEHNNFKDDMTDYTSDDF